MTGILNTAVKTAWDLLYRVSPILLTGGIASSLSTSLSAAGVLGAAFSSLTSIGIPIAAILDPISLVSGLGGNTNFSIDDLFAHFMPVPGGTLLEFETCKFPFANQIVAGNAVIQRESTISMHMECAYRGTNSIPARIAILAAMRATVLQHVTQGGLFTVFTPAMIYSNVPLLRITDISPDPTMPQTAFQWDFEQVLITTVAAAGAASTMMSKLGSGQQSSGAWVEPSSVNVSAPQLGGLG